jgi:hypothetical protein
MTSRLCAPSNPFYYKYTDVYFMSVAVWWAHRQKQVLWKRRKILRRDEGSIWKMHRNIYMSWIGTGVLGMFEQRRNGITGLCKFTAAFSHVLWCAYVRKSPLDEPKTVKRFGKHNMSESFSIICICTPSRTVSRRTSSSNTAIELFCKCIRIELRRP